MFDVGMHRWQGYYHFWKQQVVNEKFYNFYLKQSRVANLVGTTQNNNLDQ